MIIDVEHHLFIKDTAKGVKYPSGKICERFWTEDGRLQIRISEEATRVENSLKFMEETGIDMAMLTTNPELNLEQSKKWNNYCAKVMHENPKHFVGFASIPPLGGKPALEELERAVKDLGLRGVHIMTVSKGKFLDSKEMWPFYEKVSELGIPIDVHISAAPPGFDVALRAP
jgi:predicted TIM-barrel fold metal-dependent hydrolase